MERIHKMAMALGFSMASVAMVPAGAQSALSAGGFTGWSVTPSARIQGWGTLSLAYDSQLVGAPVSQQYGLVGSNLVAGFGLLPNLEISGRIASSTFTTNCYTDSCGFRDLSANFKVGAPMDFAAQWHVAAGATDFGGKTGQFRSLYGVLTYSPGPLDFSLGYARRKSVTPLGASSPLQGVFGSAAYRPLSWLQAHVEYMGGSGWVGARAFAPAEWLPAGWSAFVGLNASSHTVAKTPRSWLSAGLTIPLYKVSDTRTTQVRRVADDTSAISMSQQALSPAPVRWPSVAQSLQSVQPAPSVDVSPPGPDAVPVTDENLRDLAELFRTKGFEDIFVGRTADGAVAVRINNASYNVNTVDGLGAALGVLARSLSAHRAGYRLVLTQRQIAIVGVTGQADCLADWIDMNPVRCTAGQLYAPGTTVLDALLTGAQWVVRGRAPSWVTPRIFLQPVLRSALATEYGVFDFSLGVRATLQQPLWSGAWAEVSRNTPAYDSDDYKQGKVFGPSRFVSRTDRYLVHQVLRLPVERLFGANSNATGLGVGALAAHVAVGRIDANYRGSFAELRWEPGEGRHRVGLEGGRFDRIGANVADLPRQSRTLLATYRYAYTPTRTSFETTVGQFLYNDRGFRFGIRQWFDDVAVSLYVRRSKFEWASKGRMSAGIEISIPLTPRKDMSPSAFPVQVAGNPRWSYGVETVIRAATNPVTTNQGVNSNVQSLDRLFNFDRSGLAYFEDNMPRIRSAARQ